MSYFYAPANPVFYRPMRNILSITQSFPCVITTTYDGLVPANHNYIDGMIVRLKVLERWGMQQIHNKFGFITVINATQFSLSIDTTLFDPYIIPVLVGPPGPNLTAAQVIPIGNVPDTLSRAATQNMLGI